MLLEYQNLKVTQRSGVERGICFGCENECFLRCTNECVGACKNSCAGAAYIIKE